MPTTTIPPKGDAQQPELLTIREACSKLRISTWTLYRLIQQRELTTIRIGRRRLVPAAAIQKFIERRSEDAS